MAFTVCYCLVMKVNIFRSITKHMIKIRRRPEKLVCLGYYGYTYSNSSVKLLTETYMRKSEVGLPRVFNVFDGLRTKDVIRAM